MLIHLQIFVGNEAPNAAIHRQKIAFGIAHI